MSTSIEGTPGAIPAARHFAKSAWIEVHRSGFKKSDRQGQGPKPHSRAVPGSNQQVVLADGPETGQDRRIFEVKTATFNRVWHLFRRDAPLLLEPFDYFVVDSD